jgi:tRNA-binding protein
MSADPATPANPAPPVAPTTTAATPPAPTPAPPVAPTAAVAPAPSVATTPADPTIQYDDFAKVQLRVATILEAAPHPNADKLLVLQVDLGAGGRRQICAGIKAWYDPATLVGKQIIVVQNLAPRTLRGQVSHGMLLAATDAATGNVIVLSPSAAVAPGSEVK